MTTESPIYQTGITPTGSPLLGGVWTHWDQNGMPLEMSHLWCQQNGCFVDWLEAMADASLTNNLPALMRQVEMFLPQEALSHIKTGWVLLMKSGATPEEILTAKRKPATHDN